MCSATVAPCYCFSILAVTILGGSDCMHGDFIREYIQITIKSKETRKLAK